MQPERVLVAVIGCPECGTEFEGTWREPDDLGEDFPEESLQLCPGCGHSFTAGWPGYSFRTEAG
jgi:RNA polymerase subunit RPABC4/transcription elongation factor Spt4